MTMSFSHISKKVPSVHVKNTNISYRLSHTNTHTHTEGKGPYNPGNTNNILSLIKSKVKCFVWALNLNCSTTL